MEDAHARGDDEPEDPDDEVRRHVVAPLMAQHRNTIRRREQQCADGEVRRVPEVIAAVLQHVLRRDRQEPAEHERPERGALRLEQQRKADAADVGALEVHDAPAYEPGEERLGDRAREERHGQPLVSADDVIAELRDHEHERDQSGNEVPRVDRFRTRQRGLRNGAGVGHRATISAR